MKKRTTFADLKIRMGKSGMALVAALILSGCAVEVVDTDSAPETPAPAPRPAPEFELFPDPEPNRYQVRFRGDLVPVQAAAVETDREIEVDPAGKESEAAEAVFGGSLVRVSGGRTYEFQVRDGAGVRSVRVAVPRDLRIDGVLEAPAGVREWTIRVSGRVFLGRSALIVARDLPFRLEAAEILSDGARIQNLDAHETAPSGRPGRTGGSIHLKAARLVGPLSVVLRGEKGGAGEPGKPHAGRAAAGRSFPIISGRCDYARQGGDGAPGLKGHRGERGLEGGSTGNLVVEIGEGEREFLRAEFEPGAGGEGGRGGLGQSGGKGGASDVGFKTLFPAVCPNFRARGADGPDGPAGDPGPRGKDGVQGRFCRLTEGRMTCAE